MIENLNPLLPLSFVLITFVTMLVLTFSMPQRRGIIFLCFLLWLALHGALAYSGFYLKIDVQPQRFMLIFPPIIILIIVLFTKLKHLIDGLPLATLTYIHTIRIPVELVLYFFVREQTDPGADDVFRKEF